MKTTKVTPDDLRGVFAVPPLCRKAGPGRPIDFAENAKLVRLAAVTLEWAVRAELVREDLRDVEEYMLHLAKRQDLRRVLVARRDGQVIAATNKGLRNQKLDRIVAGLPSGVAEIDFCSMSRLNTLTGMGSRTAPTICSLPFGRSAWM